MGVLVCFKQIAPEKKLPELAKLFPWYNRACLAMILPEGLAVYECVGRLDQVITVYSKDLHPWKTIRSSDFGVENHFLLLKISEDECVKIQNTCEACVKARLQYSTFDCWMSFMPFRDPVDLSIFKAEAVRNVQAVVLIIRECVDPLTSTLGTALKTVNSRTIFPTDLYHMLKPLATDFQMSIWARDMLEIEPLPTKPSAKPADDWW